MARAKMRRAWVAKKKYMPRGYEVCGSCKGTGKFKDFDGEMKPCLMCKTYGMVRLSY